MADGGIATDDGAAKPDRKTIIARAAVEVLGREGSRGFTHRAIDRKLALPAGTTSAYYRRRMDLVLAVFRTVVAEDLALLDRHFAAILSGDAPLAVEVVGDFMYRFIVSVIARAGPADLARYECYLFARRDPELAAILAHIVRRREQNWTVIFGRLGARSPQRSAAAFDTMLRGIFYRNSLLSDMVEPLVLDVHLVTGMVALALEEVPSPPAALA